MTNNDKHRAKLIEYLSNPDHEFLSRTNQALTILGYKKARSIYSVFTPQELTEIEYEAWEKRKRYSAAKRAQVYDALYREALKGSVQAAREYLDRTEGKVTDTWQAHIRTDIDPVAECQLPDFIQEMICYKPSD